MKKKEIRELREMTEAELNKKLDEERSSLYDIKVKAMTGQMEKTSELNRIKRRIAVIKTVINSRPDASGEVVTKQ